MPENEPKDDDPAPDAAASAAELAAALRLDLDDDEFADLALGDEELPEATPESEDPLELDDLDVMELDAGHIDEEEDDEDDEDEEPEADVAQGPPLLYLELDGRFATVDKERFVIGRVATMCDLAIRDVNVSRQHCAIERRGNDYFAVDLGSINGIVVDGRRTDNHRIAEGDVLVLSGHRICATFLTPQLTAPSVEAPVEIEYPLTTGEFPPVPAAEPEPEPEPEPQPAPEPAPAAYAPAPAPMPTVASFEERIEQRLEYMSQQLLYLQQSVHALFARMDQLQGVAALAEMIQGRLAQRRDR
jgi:hypothetical protein